MKTPSEVIQDLTGQSSDAGQSIQEWVDYLQELIDEARTAKNASEADLESQEEEGD